MARRPDPRVSQPANIDLKTPVPLLEPASSFMKQIILILLLACCAGVSAASQGHHTARIASGRYFSSPVPGVIVLQTPAHNLLVIVLRDDPQTFTSANLDSWLKGENLFVLISYPWMALPQKSSVHLEGMGLAEWLVGKVKQGTGASISAPKYDTFWFTPKDWGWVLSTDPWNK